MGVSVMKVLGEHQIAFQLVVRQLRPHLQLRFPWPLLHAELDAEVVRDIAGKLQLSVLANADGELQPWNLRHWEAIQFKNSGLYFLLKFKIVQLRDLGVESSFHDM